MIFVFIWNIFRPRSVTSSFNLFHLLWYCKYLDALIKWNKPISKLMKRLELYWALLRFIHDKSCTILFLQIDYSTSCNTVNAFHKATAQRSRRLAVNNSRCWYHQRFERKGSGTGTSDWSGLRKLFSISFLHTLDISTSEHLWSYEWNRAADWSIHYTTNIFIIFGSSISRTYFVESR